MTRYMSRGTAFDLSDVRAEQARLDYAERQARRSRAISQRAWAQGFQSAMEQVGGDITITDGIPTEVMS